MAHPRTAWLALMLLLPLGAAAETRALVEVAVGPETPVGDDAWDGWLGYTGKYALRGGALLDVGRGRLGTELEVSYARPTIDDDRARAVDLQHVRILGGLRAGVVVGDTLLFARAAVGRDYFWGSWELSRVFQCEASARGWAAEAGAGFAYHARGVTLGMQVAVPLAFHDEPDNCMDRTYRAVAVDFFLTVGTRWR